MPWLLDTNVWIQYFKSHLSPVRARIAAAKSDQLRTCSVVKAELWCGSYRYLKSADRRALVNESLAPLTSLPFDDAAAEQYARIRHTLEQQGQVIGPNDLLIAAICLANGCTIVTSNTDEFSRVPGLKCEDWSQP